MWSKLWSKLKARAGPGSGHGAAAAGTDHGAGGVRGAAGEGGGARWEEFPPSPPPRTFNLKGRGAGRRVPYPTFALILTLITNLPQIHPCASPGKIFSESHRTLEGGGGCRRPRPWGSDQAIAWRWEEDPTWTLLRSQTLALKFALLRSEGWNHGPRKKTDSLWYQSAPFLQRP